MEPLIIEKAVNADLEEIITVIEETFPQDFQFEGEFSYIQCATFLLEATNDKNEQLYVGKIEEEVVGFVYYINKPPTNGTVIVEMMGIKKEFQNQGYGTQLLRRCDDQLVAELKGKGIEIATIHLTVSSDNLAAQKAYQRTGYDKVAEIPGFVGEGNIEYLMLKKVSGMKYKSGLWTQ